MVTSTQTETQTKSETENTLVVPAYIWRVYRRDGSSMGEYDREYGLGWNEIERMEEVTSLVLEGHHAGRADHVVMVPDGATPVFFRRGGVIINPGGSADDGSEIEQQPIGHYAVCIGWRKEAADEEVYHFVLADGTSILSSDLQVV